MSISSTTGTLHVSRRVHVQGRVSPLSETPGPAIVQRTPSTTREYVADGCSKWGFGIIHSL